jgi:diguanylate cyclase (GGDEF)-like protein
VTVGHLRLQGTPTTPAEETLRILEHMARLAGMVMENAQRTEQLNTLAYVDTLTGLPNREALKRNLNQWLVGAERPAPQVICLDLKKFRKVNDRYGYSTGNDLLVQVSRRLEEILPAGGLLARMDADAFAMAVEADQVERLEQAIMVQMAMPFVVGEQSVELAFQFGFSLVALPGTEAEDLLLQAEQAIHRARRLGQPSSNYDAHDHAVELTALTLQSELKEAFSRRELSLVFQPLVEANTGTLHSMEVLLRWHHPELGTISPQVFIGLAEESELIEELGLWVLQEACTQAASWPGGPMRINVNVSARQLKQGQFLTDVREALVTSGLPASALELELTESVLVTSSQVVTDILNGLHMLGVRLALDDYGTGYSSLAYLKRFPLDVLKIDRTFIQGLGQHKEDQSNLLIVRSTIALAHELGMQVVAEGVEDEAVQVLLADLSCDRLQGYLFAAPMSLADAHTWSSGNSAGVGASSRLDHGGHG